MIMATYSLATEIRQVQFELDGLVSVLEDDWRTLFYLIPRSIKDITRPAGSYSIKYNGTQESELDSYGKAQNIGRARLLLDEWGTSGRKEERPTLGHLYALTIKADMYRAADYIAKLLKIPEPERPGSGPAAPINVDLELDREIEKQLDDVAYPNSTALQNEDLSLTVVHNLDYDQPTKREDIINPPQVIPDSIIEGSLPIFSRSNNNEQSVGIIPILSDLLAVQSQSIDTNANDTHDSDVQITNGNTVSSYSNNVSERNNSIAGTNDSVFRMQTLDLPTIMETGEIPNLSIFGSEQAVSNMENGLPALSALLSKSEELQMMNNLPRFSIIGKSDDNTVESSSQYSNTDQQSIHNDPLGTSDLIAFSSTSIATTPTLINFSFDHLKTVTADFDSRKFTNNDLKQPNGRVLGTGGFGEVFLALNLTTSYPVSAVKRLFPINYKYREKFDRERDLLSKYSHPNIVKLIGFSEDVTLCLIYEYLSGGTLGAALENSRKRLLQLGFSQRMSYLMGIATALEYLHSPLVQVVHRDVTPANILLQGDTAKLCDFGLMKRIDSLTATEVSGTGPYISPEAMRGIITPALDIYSYGVMLTEVVTGEQVLADVIPEALGEDLIERVTARGADLEIMVDRNVPQEDLRKWVICGKKLLDLANWCLRERFKRPSASAVRESLQKICSM